ncbi:MAG: hypothetical protein AAF721_26020 [Myxococcota bacterium]
MPSAQARSLGPSVILVSLALACQPSAPPTPPSDAPVEPVVVASPSPTPQAAPPSDAGLSVVEAAMMDTDQRLRFVIEATGAVEARLSGRLVLTADAVEIDARGTFAGQEVHLELRSDSGGVAGGHAETGPRFDLPAMPELRRAVVLGVTRMGLLHNLAVLLSGRPPDGADGGIEEFVVAQDVVDEVGVVVDGQRDRSPSLRPMSFSLEVKGAPAGHATVWTNAAETTVVERNQIVAFPDGEMSVVERYEPLAG